MANFTVTLSDGAETERGQGWSYSVEDSGVLTTITPNRGKIIYAPHAWHSVEEGGDPPAKLRSTSTERIY